MIGGATIRPTDTPKIGPPHHHAPGHPQAKPPQA
jgi:hypothetical protein